MSERTKTAIEIHEATYHRLAVGDFDDAFIDDVVSTIDELTFVVVDSVVRRKVIRSDVSKVMDALEADYGLSTEQIHAFLYYWAGRRDVLVLDELARAQAEALKESQEWETTVRQRAMGLNP